MEPNRQAPSPVLIGIAGGTGSGKTTVATRIVEALDGQAALVQHDWYYSDNSMLSHEERQLLNFDEPDALDNDLLVSDLRRLRAGEVVECPQYDFAEHRRTEVTVRVRPEPIIVVEGILLFAIPALRDMFDLRLFVDTDDDIRLMRRIKRDILHRGRDIRSVQKQYYETVRPMHMLHVAPSKQFAHLIIPEGGENAQAIDVIVGRFLFALSKVESAPIG